MSSSNFTKGDFCGNCLKDVMQHGKNLKISWFG